MTPPQGSGFSNSIDRLEVFFQVTTNMELMAINVSVKKFLPWKKKFMISSQHFSLAHLASKPDCIYFLLFYYVDLTYFYILR